MANMSYCRFRNTALDLEDCVDALENIDDPEVDQPDGEEVYAAERMRRLCKRYIQAYDAWKGEDGDDEE